MTRKDKIKIVQMKYQEMSPLLNERSRRCWAATEARALGHGGIIIVSEATGLDIKTIRVGLKDLDNNEKLDFERIRKPGGGRKKITEKDSELAEALNKLIDPVTRGDPESPLRWTSKSTTKLAEELSNQGHPVSQRTVCNLLHKENYSLQSNRKVQEGSNHIDRDAQFHHINQRVKQFHKKNQPVISVDTKKKELIGNFKNNGAEWMPKGKPIEVNMHDFPDKELGKAIPYGVYDLLKNEGWVNVGIDHDTSSFAVESIRRWWVQMGHDRYPEAKQLLITADSGGSNGNRRRLWKVELQKLADEFNLEIHVRHFPPGTSKWNKIEHKMFCFISQNWRGHPLLSQATVVNLISNTSNKTGLKIRAVLDENRYETGKKISDKEMSNINIHHDLFHGEWNYSIKPHKKL